MSRFWSEHIHELDPYVPGEQPSQQELIKLNTNEHAYGPSPKVFEAIQAVLNDDLRLYPSFNADDLVAALGAHHQLAGEQVFVGNSSDEVLAHVFNGLFRRTGKALWFPDVTYSFYKTYCRFYDIDPHYVPLDDNLRIRPADYHQAQAQGAAGIIFANPNAPTGHYLELGVIEELAQKNPDIPVVVDEAYIDFGGQSADVLLAKCLNLVVIRTFSKGYALAGLRAGYALASAEIVAGLQRVKDSFNSYPLDRLAQAGATAAIKDAAYYEKINQKIIENREFLAQALTKMGFEVLPSLTNFVFARPKNDSAAALFTYLRDAGVLVRYFSEPRIEQFLRITVGTRSQCERLIELLHQRQTSR